MDGAFPRYSTSTPFQKNITPTNLSDLGYHGNQVYHYRNSMDDSSVMKYSSSSSSSSTSSRQSYSPPVSSTPQRVPRKPVSNNPALKSSPQNEWKTSSPKPPPPVPTPQRTPIHSPHNKYHAADTVHPNRMRTYSQVTPLNKPIKSVPTTSSPQMINQNGNPSAEKYVRTRRHSQGSSLVVTSNKKQHMVESKTTFWYPRSGESKDFESLEPLKRGLSKKIRGLLQPHRTQIEQGATNEQHIQDCQESLKRSRTPEMNHEQNPFRVLSHTENESERNGPPLQFSESDFIQVDNYASTVQQRGPLLTPSILSQKFLVRPYRRELFRLRAMFIWLIQNIRPEYHQKRNNLILLQKQSLIQQHQQQLQLQQTQMIMTPSKSSNIRQRLSRITHLDDNNGHEDPTEIQAQKLDAMELLQEESTLLLESANDYINESADEVLETRTCKSSFGMAHLFVAMALAAGFEEAKVIHGYLKAPKDTTSIEDKKLPLNHAWCSVKIEGEYRLIDCWLASPFHPQNENKMEPHWFLTLPSDMILTHLPKDPLNQFLNPPLTQHAFFSLPHVRNSFFSNRVRILHYQNQLFDEGGIFYVSLKLEDAHINCYAETEADDGTTARGLAQCLTDDRDRRICKIKAVLPPHQTEGWLKIYNGTKVTTPSNHQQQEILCKNNYQLAMCIRITQPKADSSPYDFVQLYLDHNEFYVQEPQCQKLYPLQTYHFCIRGNRLDNYNRAMHHKLAIKSPGGRLFKLMYYPQDQTYDGTVTVSEAGKWSLICLLHHTGGWYTVASWYCNIVNNKK